jgi:Trk-type K+ transport system membrane component
MIMFGLAVVASMVLRVRGGSSLAGGTGVNGAEPTSHLLSVVSGLGWIGFISLFLGWLAAMGGAQQGYAVKGSSGEVREVKRPAA